MAAPNGRIEPGQPLESAISARAWNRAQDAADIVLGAGAGMSAAGFRMAAAPFAVLPCKNNWQNAIPRYGVLGIHGFDAVEIKPTSDESDSQTLQFLQQPVLRGELPFANEPCIAIAVQPIPAGAVGWVAMAGVCQARIEIKNAGHSRATTKHANSDELVSCGSGGYPIIWKPNETGTGKYALVMVQPGAQETIRLGKISAGWIRNTNRDVDRYNGDGSQYEEQGQPQTFSAINRFADISVPSGQTRWVACAMIDATWHLVAAEC